MVLYVKKIYKREHTPPLLARLARAEGTEKGCEVGQGVRAKRASYKI